METLIYKMAYGLIIYYHCKPSLVFAIYSCSDRIFLELKKEFEVEKKNNNSTGFDDFVRFFNKQILAYL